MLSPFVVLPACGLGCSGADTPGSDATDESAIRHRRSPDSGAPDSAAADASRDVAVTPDSGSDAGPAPDSGPSGPTIYAASCNVGAVQAAIDQASDGYTVVIPNGACSWSSGIATSKQITLTGASAPTRSAKATDGVTITNTNPDTSCNGSPCPESATLLSFTIGSAFHTTIANIRFLPGIGKGAYVAIKGTGLAPLMHDMYFNLPDWQLFQAVQWTVGRGGVIWNSTFDSTENLGGACGTQVGSGSGCFVAKFFDVPWDAAPTLGALDADGATNLYVEDSIFSNIGAIDLDENSRVVLRHNTVIGSGVVIHGPSSGNGGRHWEVYDNAFLYPNPNRNLSRYFWARGGTGVITGNSVEAIGPYPCYGTKDSFEFIVETATRLFTQGCCTGYMCWHQPGSGSTGALSTGPYVDSSQCSPENGSSCGRAADPYQTSDPIYIWNNTGTGQGNVGTNDSDFTCNTGNTTASFFHLGRDYFVDTSSNPNNGAKPGWSRYTYPHPLRATAP
jgi:hypothetical protein